MTYWDGQMLRFATAA